ncbi:MAG: hypothetical protein E7627_05335 [Ruminococcaceae bacterium]|nr:hypothetical protein [Oscillospiraceae bacterium]
MQKKAFEELAKSINPDTFPDDIKAITAKMKSYITKKHNNSIRAEEYKNQIKHFEELNDELVVLYNQYCHSYEDLIKIIEEKAHGTEYCKGGECIHRGYYSPSYSDLFIGNITRGRLLKKLPNDNKYSYEYIFDENHNLICSKKYGHSYGYALHDYTEVLIYEDNRVLSLIYNEGRAGKGTLRGISECLYEDGKLTEYVLAWFPAVFENGASEINVETFSYDNDLVKSLEWHNYFRDIGLVKHFHYSLGRDNNNYIVSITEKDMKDGSVSEYAVNRKLK